MLPIRGWAKFSSPGPPCLEGGSSLCGDLGNNQCWTCIGDRGTSAEVQTGSVAVGQVERQPAHNFENSAVDTGECMGTQQRGQGEQLLLDGVTHAGQWELDKAQGKGNFRTCRR